MRYVYLIFLYSQSALSRIKGVERKNPLLRALNILKYYSHAQEKNRFQKAHQFTYLLLLRPEP